MNFLKKKTENSFKKFKKKIIIKKKNCLNLKKEIIDIKIIIHKYVYLYKKNLANLCTDICEHI